MNSRSSVEIPTTPIETDERSQPAAPLSMRWGQALVPLIALSVAPSVLSVLSRDSVSSLVWFALAAVAATWKADYRWGTGIAIMGVAATVFLDSDLGSVSWKSDQRSMAAWLLVYILFTGSTLASVELLHRTRRKLAQEIRAREKATEALRQSEAEFRAGFELSSIGIVLAEPTHGSLLRVNPKFCEITGYAADELIGKRLFEFIHPEDRPQKEIDFGRLLDGDLPLLDGATRYLHKDGSVVWVHVNVNVIRDANGRPIRTHAAIQDVTAQRQSEEELKRSAARSRRLFETAHHGIWEVDRNGITTYSNRRLAEMLGRAPEELLGRRAIEFSDPNEHDSNRQDFSRHMSGESATSRWRLKRADGSYIWTLSSANPVFDDAGKVVGAFALLTDITEYRMAEQALSESEAQLRAMAEAIPDMIFKWRADGECEYASSRFHDYVGDSAAAAGKPGLREVLHEEDGAHMQRCWADAIQIRQPWSCKLRLCGSDGTYRWFMMKAVPLQNEQGTVTRWLGAATDIDVLVRAEETLSHYAERHKQLSRQLLELQESERRHIARELHDQVGQSLSLVELHLQGMQLQAEDGAIKPQLKECYTLVEKVIEQIQRLSFDLRPTMLDDLGLIPALRWYTNQARTVGLNAIFASEPLEMRLDAGLETTCYRIVQEALTNVIRHAKAKWVCVDLLQSTNELHVTVCDNGNGFDVGAVRRQHGGNSCLGLLGMEERAALAGGKLEIKSVPNHGTEVHAWFPLNAPSRNIEPNGDV
jgi:PAS domain S-box-containing protein